jgi:hypothetical protein
MTPPPPPPPPISDPAPPPPATTRTSIVPVKDGVKTPEVAKTLTVSVGAAIFGPEAIALIILPLMVQW